MQEQISPNATRTIHTYTGPTRDPIAAQRERVLAGFAGFTPEECRRALEEMGAFDPDRKRARVWDRFTLRERREFLRIAGHNGVAQAERDWRDLAEPTRAKVWAVIRNAAAWGDKVREALQ